MSGVRCWCHRIPFDAVFAEVHRSNMTKVNTPAEAKLVKGSGYEPPDIAGVLAVQPDCVDPAECVNGPFPHQWHTSCQKDHDQTPDNR